MRNRTITRETWRAEAKRQGLTLESLAERTGVSHRAILAYAAGARRPSDAWIERVVMVLEAIDDARAVPERAQEEAA